ncbi:MAG: TolC family outer membrane protein [Gammaproteobacteria bacterium]
MSNGSNKWRYAALAAVVLVVAGSGARAETLNQALADAWHNNPRVQAARAGESAAESDLSAARGEWYPKIGLTGQVGRDHTSGSITFFNPPQDFNANLNQASIALRLDQPLYEGGRLSSTIAASEASASASRAQTHARGAEVLLNAVKAYLDVIASQKLLMVQKRNVNVIDQQRQSAKEALAHGEGTKTDVAQAEARLQAAIATRIRAQATLAEMRALYRAVIGHPPGTLSLPGKLPLLPATLAEAETLASRNYQVVAARFNAQSAAKQADAVGDAVLPKIGLFAEVRREREPQYGFERLNDEEVGISLSIPIWRGGTLRAKTAAAHARADEATLEARAAADQAKEQVVSAWHNYAAARAAYGADKAGLSAARIASGGVADQHRHGERTLLDVLNAEQEARNANAALIQARRDRIVAAYALLAATGRLSAAALGLPAAGHEGYKP